MRTGFGRVFVTKLTSVCRCGIIFGRSGAYDEDGSEKDFWSKPQSHTLYAMKRASPLDSIMFVRRNTMPIMVRKMNAVNPTPNRVDDNGDEAADGYAMTIHHAEVTYATAVAMSRPN